MTKLLWGMAAIAAAASAPVNATVLLPGTTVTAGLFDPLTKGKLLDSRVVKLPALTFTGDYRVAVYQNSTGTLDFWYQFARTGKGTKKTGNDQAVVQISGSDFTGFDTQVFYSALDLDGKGIFTAASNPGTDTTKISRTSLASDLGAQINIGFGTNNLAGKDISNTYIIRTGARRFDEGTIGALAGDATGGLAFEPAAVPEPATWAMLVGGFGLVGGVARRARRASRRVLA